MNREKPRILGVDVNSEGLTMVSLSSSGRITNKVLVNYRMEIPRPGWTEQDPSVWWNAFIHACKILKNDTDLSNIDAIGLTGQMHSTVLLDQHGEILTKALLWNDQRSSDSLLHLEQIVESTRIKEITGNQLMPAFTATKIQWIKENNPEIFNRISKVLIPKDYIQYQLTGEIATDVNNASGTGLFCVEKREWSDELINAFGFRREWFPDAYESSSLVGRVKEDVAAYLGFKSRIPVIAGAGDMASSAVGAGMIGSGQGIVHVESAGAVLVATDDPAMFKYSLEQTTSLHNFCHAIPNMWFSMGTTLSAGLSLHWFYNALTALGEKSGIDYTDVTHKALELYTHEDNPLFLPYLGGERTPHLDSQARGVFFGLNFNHDVRHMIRAVMEGVAFSMRDCAQVIEQANLSVGKLRLTGEIINEKGWSQVLADVLGTELCVPNHQGAAEGIALLAGISIGVYDLDMITEKPCIANYCPNEEYRQLYNNRYDKYQSLYRSVARLF